MREYLPYLEEQGMLWLDGEYIIDPYLQNKKEYKGLLRRQDRNYYMPDSESVLFYGSEKTLVKNEEYETVFRLLTKEIRDRDKAEEILEEISGYVTREDWGVKEAMNCLYDQDVAFSSDRTVERMVEALSNWTYTIRRWSECGYCRKELQKENEDLKYVTAADQKKAVKETEKKVYPNDPCPCGSGKKYKKCCGRK